MRKSKKPFYHPKAIVETSQVGEGTRVWAFTHLMKGSSIGKDCNIGDHCFVESGCTVGNRVTVKNGVSLWNGVRLEDDVFVGPNAVFTNDLYPISRLQPPVVPTLVKRGACLGANATVVCGATVGSYAFVGAGSVVTETLPDHAFAYGNPARVKGFLCRCRQKLKFKNSKAVCVCGLTFKKLSQRQISLV